MKANETNLQDIIEGSKQYIIPMFQRTYSWEQKQWHTLWEDLMELVEDSVYDTHFIGGEWVKPQGMTVLHIMVATNGPFFNANSVSRCRFQTNGAPLSPCVLLSCTLTNNWLYGNTFSNINFEIPNAGAIHLHSCFAHSLQDIQIFDADLFGPIS